MNFQKQKGVALVVGLVMLLVLTIMGVSSMSNTTTELKIACNYQTHNDAFQGATSAVEFALGSIKPGLDYPITLSHQVKDSNSSVDLVIEELGCQSAYGGSLTKGGAYELIYSVDSSSISTGCGGEAYSNIMQAVAIKFPDTCANYYKNKK